MSKRVQATTVIGSPGCPVIVALLAHPCGHHETTWGVHGKSASGKTSGRAAGCPHCVWKTWKSVWEIRREYTWTHGQQRRACLDTQGLQRKPRRKLWGRVVRVRPYERSKLGSDVLRCGTLQRLAFTREAGALL